MSGSDTVAGRLFGDGARALQQAFDSERLANTLEAFTMHDALSDDDITLVRAQSTVWISTVDADGWPDVSYKGGAVGFVEVVDEHELRIPIYDGNGMWRTLGNIVDDGRIALLFIDTERPWRMRVHGRATVSIESVDVDRHHGAQAVIIVRVGRAFPNCGRYIHRDGEISKFVPRPDHAAPMPDWKRIDELRDVLPARDQEALAGDARSTDGSDGSDG